MIVSKDRNDIYLSLFDTQNDFLLLITLSVKGLAIIFMLCI